MTSDVETSPHSTPVFFVAGGTGISAETLGNMMLQQFPSVDVSAAQDPVHHDRRSGPARWSRELDAA